MLGVDPETMNELVNNVAILSPAKTRDLLAFAVKCARDPQSIGEEDFATLRGHGLSQEEIVEAIAMSALAVYANIMADATGVEDDVMFSTL
jgi:alkylhydroperoxidase family enzyme